MKKYELTEETKEISGVRLHRIRALCDFGDVKSGDLGGWIEGEYNLNHDGDAWVRGNAWVSGDATVNGNAVVRGNAWVTNKNDYLNIYPIGSQDDSVTFYRLKDGGLGVSCGCFTGTLNDFIEAVAEEHGDNQHGKEYMAAVELAKVRFGVD